VFFVYKGKLYFCSEKKGVEEFKKNIDQNVGETYNRWRQIQWARWESRLTGSSPKELGSQCSRALTDIRKNFQEKIFPSLELSRSHSGALVIPRRIG